MAKEIVEAPIAGKILRVYLQSGDKVEEGDVICEIEAMKMENPILSPVSGKINEIQASSGQPVKAGETIAIIEH